MWAEEIQRVGTSNAVWEGLGRLLRVVPFKLGSLSYGFKTWVDGTFEAGDIGRGAFVESLYQSRVGTSFRRSQGAPMGPIHGPQQQCPHSRGWTSASVCSLPWSFLCHCQAGGYSERHSLTIRGIWDWDPQKQTWQGFKCKNFIWNIERWDGGRKGSP